MSGNPVSPKAVFLARVGWLILPVILAGFIHVVVLKTDALRQLAIPIDGGRRWRGRPLLGSHKTWRGVLLMTALSATFTRLQAQIGWNRREDVLSVTRDYRIDPLIAGGMMGFAYCLSELPNSFVKRQLGVPPGDRSIRGFGVQYMVDQGDSVFGCLMTLRLLYRPRPGEIALAFVLGTAIHVGIDRLLHLIGVKPQM